MASVKKQSGRTVGYLPVMAAIGGNFIVGIFKFIGFLVSGSGALFSESIHSLADISNQVLLMVGIKRSVKKANDNFSYGFGRERFFWAVISACCIFFLGAGVTISHGIQNLIKGQSVEMHPILYLILIVSFIIESGTLFLAWRELKHSHKDKDIFWLLKYGDPSTIAVLYEDSVAVLGVAIALGSVILTRLTGDIYWDSLGSIFIGILLCFVALLMINKNRGYLIGKSMPEELKEKIIEVMQSDSTIEKVLDFKSITLDVDLYRIKCEVEFNSPILLKEAYKSGFREEYDSIKNDYEEFIKFMVSHTDRIPRMVGKKIDELEKKVRLAVPEVRHIDIEIN